MQLLTDPGQLLSWVFSECKTKRKSWRLTGESISNKRSAEKCIIDCVPFTKDLWLLVWALLSRHMCTDSQRLTHILKGDNSRTWHTEARPEAKRGPSAPTQALVSDTKSPFDKQRTRWCFINQQNVVMVKTQPQSFRAISLFLSSSPFIALSICCSLGEKP